MTEAREVLYFLRLYFKGPPGQATSKANNCVGF
ncbi:hypothetical protein Lepil_2838 [Leptonema illini DSM 21528]|uniref:Uncharacterized protein n=1 Tax=Leptonema illini DSM 21528 TaxID=929563 RepID=H2CD32_9LEPT|nr:hypothetical protein Lepil_2838 [Leptonema illini DSM 21528]